MRFRAILQQYDEPKLEVAHSDSREFVERAAIAYYTALLPSVIHAGENRLRELIRQGEAGHDDGDFKNTLENRLSAAEWTIALYERKSVDTPDDPEREHKDVDVYLGFIGPVWEPPSILS